MHAVLFERLGARDQGWIEGGLRASLSIKRLFVRNPNATNEWGHIIRIFVTSHATMDNGDVIKICLPSESNDLA